MRTAPWTPLAITIAVAIAIGTLAPRLNAQTADDAKATNPPSIEEIITRANQASYYRGADGRAQVKMTITDAQGRERQRRFTILRRDTPAPADAKEQGDAYTGEQQFYLYFTRPSDVNRMGFLVHKHLDRDDDRWLYLPALDLVKRIAASDKRTSFVGSDFTYEDVSGRRTTDDTHTLREVTEHYYVVDNVPVDPKSVEFAKYTVWIHKETFLPVKSEYVDAAGKVIRTYAALAVETIGGHATVTKSSMKDERTGSTTVLEYSDVEYDIGLPEEVFTERSLRTPPRKWLK